MKTVVIRARRRARPLSPAPARGLRHYHFAPRLCAPPARRASRARDPVPASPLLRRAALPRIDDLNAQLAHWIDDIAHRRAVPGDPRALCLRRARGRTLGAAVTGASHRDRPRGPHRERQAPVRPLRHERLLHPARARGPAPHARRLGPRGACARWLREVARHPCSYDRKQTIEHREHLDELATQKRAARELRGRDLVRRSCPSTDSLLGEIVPPRIRPSDTTRIVRSTSTASAGSPRPTHVTTNGESPAPTRSARAAHRHRTAPQQSALTRSSLRAGAARVPGCAADARIRHSAVCQHLA
ncbi:Hypothetical protein I5071_070 (plasmid) [Sandaracinus amylolyticus]|nr:Hypothetical protein I5071_070 [Sandaracinus amylolyticus]